MVAVPSACLSILKVNYRHKGILKNRERGGEREREIERERETE
jgi:hypothetical protein